MALRFKDEQGRWHPYKGSTGGLKAIRWQAVWRDPKGKQRAANFPRLRDAQEHERKQRSRVNEGTYRDASAGRVPLADYLEHHRRQTVLAPNTRQWYEGLGRRYVVPALGHVRIADLTRADVSRLIEQLQAEGMGATTVHAVYRYLRAVLTMAVDERRIVENPITRLKVARPAARTKRFLSADELIALAEAVPDRYRAMILFQGTSGLRLGEAVALRVKHLDLMRGRVHVEVGAADVGGHRIEGPTKNRKSRTVQIGPPMRTVLAEHLERFSDPRNPEAYVFTTDSGKPVLHNNFRRRVFAPAAKQAGLGQPMPTPHDLRHTAVALATAEGAHPKAIQEMCGHSSITVTLDTYGHLFPTQQDALAAAVSARVAEAMARP